MSDTPDMRASDELKRSREMLEQLERDLDALRLAGAAGAAANVAPEPVEPSPQAAATPAPVHVEATTRVDTNVQPAHVRAPEPIREPTMAARRMPTPAAEPEPIVTDMACALEPETPAARVTAVRVDPAMRQLAELVVQTNRLLGATSRLGEPSQDARGWAEMGMIGDDLAKAAASLREAMERDRAWPLGRVLSACTHAAGHGARAYGGAIEIDREVIERLEAPLVESVRALARAGQAPDVGALPGGPEIRAAVDEEMLEIRVRTGAAAGRLTDLPALRELRRAVRGLHGSVVVEEARGGGAAVRVSVPRCPWFVRAMVVAVGEERFALPVACVGHVVELGPSGRDRVVLVPGGAAPVLDARTALECRGDGPRSHAVVLSHQGRSVALAVSRVVGVQGIVMRPMDPVPPDMGPIAGAGAGSDGEPVLIVDVARVVEIAAQAADRVAA